ncbi:metal-dependent hydrolase family protein [Campylobacter geochelonis]|uniref:Dihydroorotase n=1 Tax=Campylobacter geochelonis TaxID=1780362 RepID=A0A128ER51_9BACT|nr:amidohydrolase family protein [Campylobacter geochelonis]QKF71634.1 amidohydrolase family protein [Campylobacter geochelonis]CZE49395.1 Dihydroorotase [Campylobacter geochelonis]CZE51558.1 Dihydroorotase [Campylobacter geochelonis]
MNRREVLKGLGALGGVLLLNENLLAKEQTQKLILIKNAQVFDGVNLLKGAKDVLIENNIIKNVADKIDETTLKDTTIIDAKGKFLMPGLTDAHWHVMFAASELDSVNLPDPGLFYANAINGARDTVMRGFTTVRDMAGAVFGIKTAIDSGIIYGPRIYPSGAFISQTSGHGDFTPVTANTDGCCECSGILERMGEFKVADGVPEVLRAVRQQLKKGASQIKIGVGGGVISAFDPLDSIQFRVDEIKAAVDAASDWGTYVCAHVYDDNGINRALDGGVKSIEHGQLVSEKTVARMAKDKAWLSLQPFEYNEFSPAPKSPKGAILNKAWRNAVKYAKKHNCRFAFGTDCLFNPAQAKGQNFMLCLFASEIGELETLRLATSNNCELFKMSKNRDPYGEHELGRVKNDAYADLILIDGDPLKDIFVLSKYEDTFKVIIKDGVIVKNTLA